MIVQLPLPGFGAPYIVWAPCVACGQPIITKVWASHTAVGGASTRRHLQLCPKHRRGHWLLERMLDQMSLDFDHVT